MFYLHSPMTQSISCVSCSCNQVFVLGWLDSNLLYLSWEVFFDWQYKDLQKSQIDNGVDVDGTWEMQTAGSHEVFHYFERTYPFWKYSGPMLGY